MKKTPHRPLRKLRVSGRRFLRRATSLDGWLQESRRLCIDIEFVLETFSSIALHCSGPGTAVITWLSHKDLQALLCSPLAQAGVVGCYVFFVLVSIVARKAARRIRRRETHPQRGAAREP